MIYLTSVQHGSKLIWSLCREQDFVDWEQVLISLKILFTTRKAAMRHKNQVFNNQVFYPKPMTYILK